MQKQALKYVSINVCVVSEGQFCSQISEISTKLQSSFNSINFSVIKLHQLCELFKKLLPNTFIILQTKQLSINRFLKQQLQEFTQRQAVLIMVPSVPNLQAKHFVAKNTEQIIDHIRLSLNKEGIVRSISKEEIEGSNSKLQAKIVKENEMFTCYFLKSKNKQFNALMNVLDGRFKEKENIVFVWIDSTQQLKQNNNQCILIISQYEAQSSIQLQKQLDKLKKRPFMILFKNALNTNQSLMGKFNIQTSSVLGIQKFIDSINHKQFCKASLSLSNFAKQSVSSSKVIPLISQSQISKVYSVGNLKERNQYDKRQINSSIKVFPSLKEISNKKSQIRADNTKKAFLYQQKDCKVQSTQRQLHAIDQKIYSKKIYEQNKLNSKLNCNDGQISQISSNQSIKLQIKSQKINLYSDQALKSTQYFASDTKIILNKDRQMKIKQINIKTTNLNQNTRNFQVERSSYLMKNVNISQPKNISESTNNFKVQLIIKTCQKLNRLVHEFTNEPYRIEVYSSIKELQSIVDNLSSTIPTVLVTDGGVQNCIQKLFKKFIKFNTLTLQKGKAYPSKITRNNETIKVLTDDPTIISSQLKTYISRIISTHVPSKPTSAPSDFNVLIKDNLASKVSVDEFLKPRFFSPPLFSLFVDKSKANVIVIQADDYNSIKKNISDHDKIVLLAKEGQIVKKQYCKAALTTKNPEAITGYIRKLSAEGRANTYVLFNYEDSALEQQIHKRMKGKLIQLKYHDEESLIKKATHYCANSIVIIINLRYLKLMQQLQKINKNFYLVVYEPNYRLSIDTTAKVLKTLNQLVQQLQLIVSKK